MPNDGSGNANHSAVFRSIWKGSDQTVGARGQLRMEVLTHMLGRLTWRELGLLLVQLSQQLGAEPSGPDASHRLPWIRCLASLAGTIAYMQMAKKFSSDGPVVPVNSAFVATIFANITAATLYAQRKVADMYSEVVYPVFRAIAVVLAACETDEPLRFATDAVLNGLLGSDSTPEEPPKRRRTASSSPTVLQSLARERNGFLRLLGDTLHDTVQSCAHKHIIHILRAQNGAVVTRATTGPDSELAQPLLLRLVYALTDRAFDLMDPDSHVDEAYLGSVFACIRDTVPLAKAPSADRSASTTPQQIDSAAKVSKKLGALFKPYVHEQEASSLYNFCAAKRHRCYQWAALCHISTWISGWCSRSNIAAEAVAECGRLCWLQIVDMTTEDGPTNHQISLLLLCESLGHIALAYPSLQNNKSALHTPLFMRSIDTQKQAFSGLALLIPWIIEHLPTIPFVQKTTRSLVLKCLHLCEKILRLIRPQGASLGLPISGNRATVLAEEEDSYHLARCTPEEYIFRPECAVLLANPVAEDPPDISVRQEREESQECDREIRLGNMLTAFSILSGKIADDSSTHESGISNILAMAFRTSLRWINAFAVSARDNAGKQLRLLETQRRINIGLVGDKARLLTFATDWTRLQKIPVVRQSHNSTVAEAGDSAEKSTYKPAATQMLRVLAALSVRAIVGGTNQSNLKQCLTWGSEDANDQTGAEHVSRFYRNMESMLSESDFDAATFSSLQTLASIFGLRSHLFAYDIASLRLPDLQVRSHSPESTEALMQLAIQTGICRLLLDPHILKVYIGRVRDGKLLETPLALCSYQIWLDMIGNVVRHSLFRTYIGLSHGSQDNNISDRTDHHHLLFKTWWRLALALSIKCLLDVLEDSDGNAERVRLACIMPSHLVSWLAYLPMTEGFIRGLVCTGYSQYSDIDLGPFKSVVYTIFFLACRLWREIPMLDQNDLRSKNALRICRDVWGISYGSIRFLKHAARYRVVRRAFMELNLAPKLCEIVADLLSGTGTPELILSIKSDAMISSNKLHLPGNGDMEHDPLSFPLLELSENIDLASDEDRDRHDDSQSIYIEPRGTSEDSSGDDMIERLLLESSQQRKSASKQRSFDEYYSTSLLAPLWLEYTNQLLALPAFVAFGSETDNFGQAVFFDMLTDSDGIIFQLFSPLLAAKQHLAADNALWLAVHKAAPLKSIMHVIKSAPPESIPHISVAAALILPELASVKQSADIENGVIAIVGSLVDGLFCDRKDRCALALLFLAWRQRQSICNQAKKCLGNLRSPVSKMLESMKSDATLLEVQEICAIDKRRFQADRAQLNDDLVTLSGTEMKSNHRPIATSMALLAKHSSVFSILFTGGFSEAQAVLSGRRHFDLDSYHSTLVGLIDLIHKCVISAHYEEIVFSPNLLEEDVDILRLAIFYDLRPVIVLLACHISERVCNDCIIFANDDGVQALAETFCENWELYFSSAHAVKTVHRSIAAVALLSLDRIDLASVIEDDSSSFADAATYLFQGLQDV